MIGGELTTLLALPPEEGGYQNDPILGVVDNLGITGVLLDVLQIYVGILAATILFIATNAGIIGASRITYSMASYRQLPGAFRKLHPKFKTPWLALVVFAGFVSILVLLPGQVDFLGTMYSFGAMLSFTVAHAAVIQLRRKDRGARSSRFARARTSGIGRRRLAACSRSSAARRPFLAWLVVVVQDPPTRYAGLAWLAVGLLDLRRLPARGASRPAHRDGARAAAARPGDRARVPDDRRPDRGRESGARGDAYGGPARPASAGRPSSRSCA